MFEVSSSKDVSWSPGGQGKAIFRIEFIFKISIIDSFVPTTIVVKAFVHLSRFWFVLVVCGQSAYLWELFDRYCSCPYLIDTLVERGVTEDRGEDRGLGLLLPTWWPWIIHLILMSLSFFIQINVKALIHRIVLRSELDNGFESAL